MDKKQFNTPEIEIVNFTIADVIATSISSGIEDGGAEGYGE